jgi:Uma2 family endonuclease
MATQPAFERQVSVEEYLSMVFEHDCEYVQGVIEERDFGEFEHAYIQTILAGLFLKNRKEWGVYPIAERRVQTHKTHFRVPDVTVLREGTRRESIFTHPPFMVIEVQSPDQPLRHTAEKALEYLTFGIEHVWVVDPYARVGYRGTPNGLELVRTGELSIPGSPIRIVLEELFAELDRV